MRYLPNAAALFIHIPRTGGTWVENAIEEMGIEWLRGRKMEATGLPQKHQLVGHLDLGKRRVDRLFTFVRHPITYYESVWKFFKDAARREAQGLRGINYLLKKWPWHPHRTAALNFDHDFNEWVLRMVEKEPLWYTRLIEQFVGPEGGEYVHAIGRTEHLVRDFRWIMCMCGFSEEVERIKTLGKVNAREEEFGWDSALYNTVMELEDSVISRFYRRKMDVPYTTHRGWP